MIRDMEDCSHPSLGTWEDERAIEGAPTLDEAALHGAVGDIVRSLDGHTEAHPAGLLFTTLAAIGACIGRGPHQLLDGTRHGVNLFVAVTGPTSDGRKGTAMGWARRVLSAVDADFARRNVTGGLSTGEGIVHAVRDGTLADAGGRGADTGVADKRLLVIADELGGAFRKMQARESTLAHVLREAWDGSALRTLTRREPMLATDPHIALVGSITPEELRAVTNAGDFAGGTINRLLVTYVERVRALPRGGDVPPEFDRITAHLSRHVTQARSVGRMDLSGGAWNLWETVYHDLTAGKPGAFGQATRRAAPLVRRLAALYCLTDGRREITERDLGAALAAWQYAENSARYVFGAATLSTRAQVLLSELTRHPTGVTRTHLRKAAGSNNIPAEKIVGALIELRDAGLARTFQHRGTGRPAEVWQLSRHFLAQNGNNGIEGKKVEEERSTSVSVEDHPC